MILYLLIIVLLFMFSVGKIGNIRNQTLFVFFMIIFWFLASFRSYEIGNDTATYQQLFESIAQSHSYDGLTDRFEVGYLYTNKLLGELWNNFTFFLTIINLFIYYAYYRLIKEYSANVILSLLLFLTLGFWGQTVNVIRLQIAIALYIYSYLFRNKNKYVLAILCGLLAFFFQRISLAYALVFIIPKTINRKFWLLITLGTAGGYLLFPVVMNVIIRKIPYYAVYASSNQYKLNDPQMATVIMIMLNGIIVWLGLHTYLRNKSLLDRRYHIDKSDTNLNILVEKNKIIAQQTNMILISLSINIVSLRFNLLDRCSAFYWIFSLLLIPNIIDCSVLRNNRRIAYVFVLVACAAYFFVINIFRPGWNHIYPYSTIF